MTFKFVFQCVWVVCYVIEMMYKKIEKSQNNNFWISLEYYVIIRCCTALVWSSFRLWYVVLNSNLYAKN